MERADAREAGVELDGKAIANCNSSTPQCEDYVDGSFDFDGFSAKEIGAVAPGFDGVDCCLLQHGLAADGAQILLQFNQRCPHIGAARRTLFQVHEAGRLFDPA